MTFKLSKRLSRAERAIAYNTSFPRYPPLHISGRWVYGIWEIGNNYKGSGYYGSYPPTYVKRVLSMFPDMRQARMLHLFAGLLRVPGVRVDLLQSTLPSIVADAKCLPFKDGSFEFVMADPPYSPDDAKRYNTPMINRGVVMRELARVVRPGGHIVWLDIPKPMFRKSEWEHWGSIGVLRSTNHRGRFAFIFERRTYAETKYQC